MDSSQGTGHRGLHCGLSGRAVVGVGPGSCLLGPPEHTCSDGLVTLLEAGPSYPHRPQEKPGEGEGLQASPWGFTKT